MGTLERYILRQLIGPLGFFTLVLTGIVWLTQSLRILDIVIANGQGAHVLLEFSALLLPVVLAIVLQLGGLIATVYALHRMISESEIIAAVAGGASRARLARPIALFGAILSVILAGITLYFMPVAARALNERIAEVRGDLAAGLVRDGRFISPVKGMTVFVSEITPDGEMRGLFLKDAREGPDGEARQATEYFAKRAWIETPPGGPPAVIMYDLKIIQQPADGRRLDLIDTFEDESGVGWTRYEFDILENTQLRPRKVSERFFYELINPDPTIAKSPKDVGKFIAEGHEQLSAPLYGLALPLVAAAAMLGAAFSRHGPGRVVGIALLLGAAVRVVGIAAKNATTGTPELWPIMYLIPLAAIAFSLLYLMRSGLKAPSRGGATRLGPTSAAPSDPAPDETARRPAAAITSAGASTGRSQRRRL